MGKSGNALTKTLRLCKKSTAKTDEKAVCTRSKRAGGMFLLAVLCGGVLCGCANNDETSGTTTADPKLYGYEIVTSPTEPAFTIGQTVAVTEETEPITSVVTLDEYGNPVIDGGGYSIAAETSPEDSGDLGFISSTAPADTTEPIDFSVVTTPPLDDDVVNSEGIQNIQQYSSDLEAILPDVDYILEANADLAVMMLNNNMEGAIASIRDDFLPAFQSIYDTISAMEIKYDDIKPVHNHVVEAYRLIVKSFEALLQGVEEDNSGKITESDKIMQEAQQHLLDYQDGLSKLMTKYVAYN